MPEQEIKEIVMEKDGIFRQNHASRPDGANGNAAAFFCEGLYAVLPFTEKESAAADRLPHASSASPVLFRGYAWLTYFLV